MVDSQEESGMPSRPVMEFNHLDCSSVSHDDENVSGLPPLEDVHLIDSLPDEYDPELLGDLEDLVLQIDITDIG